MQTRRLTARTRLAPTPPVLLLTGFEPFGGDSVNPSWEIARRLDGWLVFADGHHPEPEQGQAASEVKLTDASADTEEPGDGQRTPLAVVRAALLPCVFHGALAVLDHEIARHRPIAIIGLGLAASRQDISVERVAINIDDARIPDNAGRRPIDEPVCPGAPAAYWSTLPIKAIVAALGEAGIPASVSQSAGTFVCNHVFFGLAHRLARRRRRPPVAAAGEQTLSGRSPEVARGGFIHVPWPADQEGLPPATACGIDLQMMTEAVRIAIRVTLTTSSDLRAPGGALD